MAIKAVFFDIDGTLLNDAKRVQKSTQKAIKEMQANGTLVGIATGRGPGFVQPFMENLSLDFAVTYNGQYIFTRDAVVYQNQLPKSLIYRVIRYASDKKREISLGTSSGLVGSGIIGMGTSSIGQLVASIVPKKWAKGVEQTFKQVIRRFKPQNMETLKVIMREPVFQIVMVATEDETTKIQQKFPHIKITRSSPYSADLISKNQSKLKGIERLGERLGFDLSEVMAFGDSENDSEMLAGVGVGVAMGNAQEAVKELAHYITASNNQDGIAKALSHFGLIQDLSDEHFTSSDNNFNQVQAFHQLMDGSVNDTPVSFDSLTAGHRAAFKIEELVEFIYAANRDSDISFQTAIKNLHTAVDKAAAKVKQRAYDESVLVEQIDALVDLLYLTYGSFVLMGVDPKPFFDIVHESNMGKIFPDGKAHFDPVTHKILKPDDWEQRFAPESHLDRELNRQIQKAKTRQKPSE